jgi:hypothetical protein
MRSVAAFVALLALILAASAFAQPVKQVEVTNLPAIQAVNVTNDATNPVEVVGEIAVTNLPAPSGAARFQLVGFSSATYTGAMGGNFGVTQKCQLEFPTSRMCSIEEAVATTSIPSGLSGHAWTHAQAAVGVVIFAGDPVSQSKNCFGWRSSLHTFTGNVISDEGTADVISDCDREHPIACCALVP